MGYYGNRYSTIGHGISWFFYAHYNVTPLIFKKFMVALSPFPYFVDLAADTESSSLHVIIRCVVSSSTSHDDPSPLTVYAENP